MDDLVVREATAADSRAVDDLLVDVYVGDGWVAADHADDMRDAAARARHATIFIACDGANATLGTATVVTEGEPQRRISTQDEAEIRLLAVSPGARGRGAGAALTVACVGRARSANCSRVVLATLPAMKDAQRVYERLGFVRTPERDAAGPTGAPMWMYALELDN